MMTMSICIHKSVSSQYNFPQMLEHSLSMCNSGDEKPLYSKKPFFLLFVANLAHYAYSFFPSFNGE